MTTKSLVAALLLIGAALLAASASQARPTLLPEGSHPPAFTLPDRAGHAVSLRSFLGPRRVVLLFGPTQRTLDTIQSQHGPFADRDLTVLAVVPPGSRLTATAPGIHTLTDTDGKIAERYGAPDGKSAFYLIGKDGHIAVAQRTAPTPRRLFGIIDAMPMRRQEMRQRGR